MASLPPLALPGDRLEHLTKHRTKKPPQSQKRPPSRKFLQRQKDLVSADLKPNVAPKPNKDISIRNGSKELGQFNQLKRVPPPVPRKPFISKHNIDLGINRGDGISEHQHDRNKVHGKQSQSGNTSENELASDRNQRSILNEIKQLHSHSEKKFKGLRNNDREDVDAECQNTLNKGSRLQGPLTFSERLKASSLKQTLGSSRKPNDLSAKLRSHVIVPAKRTYKEGSEKTASSLSSPTKGKVPAFFKRRSSDSLSSHSGDMPKSANLDKMLDEEDSVSDSLSSISDRKKVVVPLPVASLISQTSLMVDDEDLKGDSFDSTELNIDPLSALQPDSMIQHDMNDHAYYKLTDPEGNNTDLGDILSVSDSLPSLPHGYLGRIVESGAIDHASGYHDDRSFISVTDVMPVHGSSEISIKGEQSSESIIPFEIERTGFDVMEESNDEDLLEEHDMPLMNHENLGFSDGATDLDHDSFDLIIPPPPIPNESEESDVSDEDFSRIPAPPLSPVDSNDLEENVAPPPDDSDGSDVGLSKFPAVVDLSTYFQSSENQDSVFFDDSCRTESPKTSLIDSEDMSSAWAENKNGNEENIISDSAEEAGEEGERVISDKGFSKRLSLQSQVTRSRAIIETDDEDDTDAAEIDYVAEDNQTQPESNDTEAAIEANNVSLKRWSSFSSTSTDEERTAKKLNIVKLMEQRTKSFTSDSDNGRNRGKFRKTLRLKEITEDSGNRVMYYLLNGPERAFVSEELMLIPEDTELSPDYVQEW